jgi:putative redox protein
MNSAMPEQITVRLVDGMHLEGLTPAFPAPIPLDADESVGGQNLGHRPLTLLLIGLGGCMSMDAISILRKKKQVFDRFEVSFQVEQAPDHPKKYTKIHMHFIVGGQSVTPEAVERSLELSYTKYCPANAMLSTAAEITYTYEIVIAEQAAS